MYIALIQWLASAEILFSLLKNMQKSEICGTIEDPY